MMTKTHLFIYLIYIYFFNAYLLIYCLVRVNNSNLIIFTWRHWKIGKFGMIFMWAYMELSFLFIYFNLNIVYLFIYLFIYLFRLLISFYYFIHFYFIYLF